jgi:hypothetical protein
MSQDPDDLALANAPSRPLGLRVLAGVGALAFALIAVNLAVVIVRMLLAPTPEPKPRPLPPAAPTAARSIWLWTLALAASAQPAMAADWRVYGPLTIDWASWQLMDGSLVSRSRNARNQMIYLSVNCKAGQINVTGASMNWKGWEKPLAGFETRLLTDACKNRATP